MANKSKRSILHTTVDAELMNKIRILAAQQGTTKYGKFVEEGLRLVLDKYGIDYKEETEKE
jgi:hypothetical protein